MGFNKPIGNGIQSILKYHSHADHSLFMKYHANDFTALLVYDLPKINNVKAPIHHQFFIKDLGTQYFLGLEVARSNSGIFFNQCHYTLDLLNKKCMLASKPSPTPYNFSLQPHSDTFQPYPDKT